MTTTGGSRAHQVAQVLLPSDVPDDHRDRADDSDDTEDQPRDTHRSTLALPTQEPAHDRGQKRAHAIADSRDATADDALKDRTTRQQGGDEGEPKADQPEDGPAEGQGPGPWRVALRLGRAGSCSAGSAVAGSSASLTACPRFIGRARVFAATLSRHCGRLDTRRTSVRERPDRGRGQYADPVDRPVRADRGEQAAAPQAQPAEQQPRDSRDQDGPDDAEDLPEGARAQRRSDCLVVLRQVQRGQDMPEPEEDRRGDDRRSCSVQPGRAASSTPRKTSSSAMTVRRGMKTRRDQERVADSVVVAVIRERRPGPRDHCYHGDGEEDETRDSKAVRRSAAPGGPGETKLGPGHAAQRARRR